MKSILEDAKTAGDERASDSIINFIDRYISVIDKKASTAKERKEEKRAAGDPIYDAIEALIDDRL